MDCIKTMHITIKEFVPVVMAAAIWGTTWADESVLIRSDDAAVVAVIDSGTSRIMKSCI